MDSDYGPRSPPSIVSVEELDERVRRSLPRNVVLLFAPVLFLLAVLLLSGRMPAPLFIPGLIVSIVLSILGMVPLVKMSVFRLYVYSIRILQRISPPDVVVTEEYAVTRWEDTYVFTLREVPGGLYFVAFGNSGLIPATEIKVQKNFWKWSKALHVGELRVHIRTGEFSIPTPEGDLIRGEGVLLLLPVRGDAYVVHVPEFSRDRLIAVAEQAALLAAGGDFEGQPI
jgi:hypothetical protein